MDKINSQSELLENIAALKVQKEITLSVLEHSMNELIHSLNPFNSIKTKVHQFAEDRDLRQDVLKIVLSYGLQYVNKRINK